MEGVENSPMNNRQKQVPIRYALLVPFIVLMAVSVGLISHISFSNSREAVNDVAGRLRQEISTRIKEHLDSFLKIPHTITKSAEDVIYQGLLDPGDPDALIKYFQSRVSAYPSISSAYFGNPRGGLADSGREGPNGSLYMMLTDSFTRGLFKKYSMDEQGNRGGVLCTIPEFDATSRKWYIRAVEKKTAVWSCIYILSTGQDMAIAAARPVYDGNADLIGVVSVDVFLSQLSYFLSRLNIGKTGHAFIIEKSGLLVASSAGDILYHDGSEPDAKSRINAADSPNPVIRQAMKTWLHHKGGSREDDTNELEFEIMGQHYSLQVSAVQDDHGLDWLVLVVIPESDFMAGVKAGNRTAGFLIIFALTGVLIAGFFAARTITRPILQLNAAVQDLAKGNSIRPMDENTWLKEPKELIRSFNQMSHKLHQTVEVLKQENYERKQAEMELQETEERYRHLVEASNTDIFALNSDGVFLFLNSTAAGRIGGQAKDFTGRTIWDVFPSEIADRHMTGVREIISSGRGKLKETETVLQNQHRWYRINGQPLRDDKGHVYAAMFIGTDITESRLAGDQIRTALREKEVLLKEIHHRVKNNLQIISSLMSLQAQGVENEQVRSLFTEAQSRVRTISLVHESLYRYENLSKIDMGAYFESLAKEIKYLFHPSSEQIDITVHARDIRIMIEEAIPCGLIVNELLVNSLKHAFLPGEKGRIVIRVERNIDQQFVMTVSDNGAGLPETVDPSTTHTLGLSLVVELVEDQLEGSWRIDRNKGLSWTICWPLP